MKHAFVVMVVAGGLALMSAGCAADHLTASFGIASNAYRQQQIVNPDASKKNVVSVGLDCSEAAIVAKNYYDSLAAQSGGQESGQVLILSPGAEGDAKLPPPSVPEGSR